MTFRLTGVGSPSYGGRHARGGTATRGEPRERSVRRTHPLPGPAVVGGAVVLLLLSAALARPVAADLRPGMVLGRDNWEEAKDLLPDEFLQAYRRGEFRHEIRSWEPPRLGDDPIFGAALKENEGRYDLDAEGSIIERSSGKPAGPIMAWPFPKIDPADPRAAAKIVWNYFYTLYYGGNGHYRADLLWVSRHGLDRSISVDAFFKHYDGQHPKFRETNNRKDLLSQTFAEVLSPADVQGILSLTWRYRDPHARDSVWTYVPSLRRTRQVSPSNRSDGFLGSDLSQDDGPYFDGKVQDFEWKLVGEQDLLVLFDRPSFEQQALLSRLPQGGWRMVIPGGARVGFQMADWKGAPWCPVQEVLVRRPTGSSRRYRRTATTSTGRSSFGSTKTSTSAAMRRSTTGRACFSTPTSRYGRTSFPSDRGNSGAGPGAPSRSASTGSSTGRARPASSQARTSRPTRGSLCPATSSRSSASTRTGSDGSYFPNRLSVWYSKKSGSSGMRRSFGASAPGAFMPEAVARSDLMFSESWSAKVDPHHRSWSLNGAVA